MIHFYFSTHFQRIRSDQVATFAEIVIISRIDALLHLSSKAFSRPCKRLRSAMTLGHCHPKLHFPIVYSLLASKWLRRGLLVCQFHLNGACWSVRPGSDETVGNEHLFCPESLDSLGWFPSCASVGHKGVGVGRMVGSALRWLFLPQPQNG